MLCVKPWPAWFIWSRLAGVLGRRPLRDPQKTGGLSLASKEAVSGDVPASRGWHGAHLEGGFPTNPSGLITHGLSFTHRGALVFLQERKQGQMVEGSRVSLLGSQPE